MAAYKTRKKIAVIGAGTSGLLAIKCCKEEGLDIVCFEKRDRHGGSANSGFSILDSNQRRTAVSIYSKEMNAFSDFPPPRESPNYMNQELMMDYIDSYAENFDLLPYIQFEKEVVDIEESAGMWIVSFKSVERGSVNTTASEKFDGVMICTGRRQHPKDTLFPGQDTFKGKILHSQNLRSPLEFENLNVMIVGFGNSAVQAAVEICGVAKQVYISTRSGGWVVPRLGTKGWPSDTVYFRRSISLLQRVWPKKVQKYIEDSVNSIFNHDVYRIRPDHGIFAKHPVINDDLPDKILTGRVLIKGPIRSFEENGVILEEEDENVKIDAVVFATGYDRKFTFLRLSDSENAYKMVFPMEFSHQTLAVIGSVESLGPRIPVCESQCRWVSMVFSGKIKLPSQSEMASDIFQTNEQQKICKSLSWPLIDGMNYVDGLAKLGGFYPDAFANFAKDPSLCKMCLTGPRLPYQYRLRGPHPWSAARDYIMDWEERVIFPLKTKDLSKSKSAKAKTQTPVGSGWIAGSLFFLVVCMRSIMV